MHDVEGKMLLGESASRSITHSSRVTEAQCRRAEGLQGCVAHPRYLESRRAERRVYDM